MENVTIPIYTIITKTFDYSDNGSLELSDVSVDNTLDEKNHDLNLFNLFMSHCPDNDSVIGEIFDSSLFDEALEGNDNHFSENDSIYEIAEWTGSKIGMNRLIELLPELTMGEVIIEVQYDNVEIPEDFFAKFNMVKS